MKKGDICLVEIPSLDGHEQSGVRPAIILADTSTNIAIIIPLTSNLQALRFLYTLEVKPSKINGLKNVSIALIFQIRAIDKKRLKSKIGELEEFSIREITILLKKLLNL